MELKRGSNGPEVFLFFDYYTKWAKSYAFLLGSRDGYYGLPEESFTRELQLRLGTPITGRFSDLDASRSGYQWGGTTTPPVLPAHRKIWLWSHPGSGANEFVGPSFELGEIICGNRDSGRNLHINHQPVHSIIGGYLGALGGDPQYSYNEVTYDQYKSLLWLLDNNPDVQEAYEARLKDPNAKVELEQWHSGYSQKADGLEDALEILFGDGGFVHPGDPGKVVHGPGKYRILRDTINGVIQFGNPSTRDTGIARKVRPQWLYALVHNINKPNDFYAIAKDRVRPAFYAIIVEAEMSLPFGVHVIRIAIPIIIDWAKTVLPFLSPLLAGSPFSSIVQVGLGLIPQLQGFGSNPLIGNLFGQAGSPGDQKVDENLIEMLGPTGILGDVPDLIELVMDLPGLAAHGSYDDNDVATAYALVAGFRR